MTPEKQIIAIANLAGIERMTPGWVPSYNDPDNSSLAPCAEPIELPNYLEDLDAIRGVVDYMNSSQPDNWNDEYFIMTLCGMTSGYAHKASAKQWCEALLRTVGEWEK